MKKLFFSVLVLFLLCPVTAIAHGGSLDEYGGHVQWNDDGTREYHYHHGWPAHNHTGDSCEYNWIDKTNKGYIGCISQEEYDRQYSYNYDKREKYVPDDRHHLSEYDALREQQEKSTTSSPTTNSSNITASSDTSFEFGFLAVFFLFNFIVLSKIFLKKKRSVNTETPPTDNSLQQSEAAPVPDVILTLETNKKVWKPESDQLTTDRWAVESIIHSDPPLEQSDEFYNTQIILPPFPEKETVKERKRSEYWESVPVNIQPVNPYQVYWTINGKSFHSTDKCFALRNAKAIGSGPLTEAYRLGHKKPCSKCVGGNYKLK